MTKQIGQQGVYVGPKHILLPDMFRVRDVAYGCKNQYKVEHRWNRRKYESGKETHSYQILRYFKTLGEAKAFARWKAIRRLGVAVDELGMEIPK